MKKNWGKIYDFYWDKLGWRFAEFQRSINNLIKWFPIIIKDRDWDQYYIYNILQFKLKNQSKYISDRDWHTRAKRDAEKMMTCVRLIEKLKNGYYEEEYADYEDVKLEFHPYKDGLKELKIVQTRNDLTSYISKYPLTYKKILPKLKQEKIDNETSICIYMGYERENKARKLLFKILEQNIEK